MQKPLGKSSSADILWQTSPSVSTHSLYKWVKALTPDKTGKKASELLEAKLEILRLQTQRLRVKEERDILKNSEVLCQGARVKYLFMNEHRHQYAISTLCRVLHVTHAGLYQWLHKPVSDREQDNARLLGLIRDSYVASRGIYGARRVFADLRETCG